MGRIEIPPEWEDESQLKRKLPKHIKHGWTPGLKSPVGYTYYMCLCEDCSKAGSEYFTKLRKKHAKKIRNAQAKGPNRGNSKRLFTSAEVREIREAYETTKVTINQLAEDHGVNYSTIQKMISRVTYKGVI